jgi:prepilin-type N-terminal cleavage/methylation domain-containing protein
VRERGFTLIELAVVVAIVVVLLAATAGFTLGSRPFALHSAVTQFDGLLAQARAVAATGGNGATLLFEPRSPLGTSISLYVGRPNGPPMSAAGPALRIDADVRASGAGPAPFAIFISSAGRATVLGGYPAGAFDPAHPQLVASEPACPVPQRRAVLLTFAAARGSTELALGCSDASPTLP